VQSNKFKSVHVLSRNKVKIGLTSASADLQNASPSIRPYATALPPIPTAALRFVHSSRCDSAWANPHETRMWANAQPDGRPAEHRWRPLFNAASL